MRHDSQFWKNLVQRVRPWVELCDASGFTDENLPSSVDWYLARCSLRDRHSSLDVPATEENLRAHNARSCYLQPGSLAVRKGHLDGAPYYVHVAAVNDQIVELQHHFFYPYNGGIPLTCNPIDFRFFGGHEGDWENVRIRFDVDANRIVEIYFVYHGTVGDAITQPTTGPGDSTHYRVVDGRPVVYSAWHSHSSYPDLAVHKRALGFTCDRTTGGKRWNGDAVVVSIDASLLLGGPFPEPMWLNWIGRWGSTRQLRTSLASNSPDGPKINDDWSPQGTHGKRGIWGELVPLVPESGDTLFRDVAVVIPGSHAVAAVVWDTREAGLTLQSESRETGWSLYMSMGMVPDRAARLSQIALTVAGDGRLTSIVRSEDGFLYWSGQNDRDLTSGWSPWQPLDTSGQPYSAFAVDMDGELVHVLAVAADGLYDIRQESVGSQSQWLGRQLVLEGTSRSATNVVTAHRTDGTLVAIYARDGRFTPMKWASSHWVLLTDLQLTGISSYPWALTRNANGQLELFGIDYDRYTVERIRQSSEDIWGVWMSLDPPPQTQPQSLAAAPEANGDLTILCGSGPFIWSARQKPEQPGAWTPWLQVGTQDASGPKLFRNPDGRLEVLGIGHGVILHSWEGTPYF